MRNFKIPSDVLALRSNMEDEIGMYSCSAFRGGGIYDNGYTVRLTFQFKLELYRNAFDLGFRPIRAFRKS